MKKIIFVLLLMGISCFGLDFDKKLNKEYYITYFSYKYKGPVATTYTLKAEQVDELNIKKRADFYSDKELPEEYRVTTQDYINTGYDRGHSGSDASFDWSLESLKSTYVLSNITPQVPIVNQRIWAGIETMERYSAKQFGTVDVINIIVYGDQILTKKEGKSEKFAKELEEKRIGVPSGYYKKIYNKEHNFSECYFVENIEQKVLKTSDYIIDCKKMKSL